ncbi:hypothetical protein [Microbacterium sp. Leaf320]|uniref:hypothetical protein n=1 Tax=Microbacterium sp. Leaf320 TaxID=1736334 RepID=UPI0012F9E772|nr:hypothetical protein [Microbacterium sp. Leaf320]
MISTICAVVTVIVAIGALVVPIMGSRKQAREARPRAVLVGGVESAPGVWVSQRIAIWNEGGTDFPLTRVDMLAFPFVFLDAPAQRVTGDGALCFGALDVAAVATAEGYAPVTYSIGSVPGRQRGGALLEAHGLPHAFVAYIPSPRAARGPLIDAILVAPDSLFRFAVRLHHASGRTQDVLVETATGAVNLDGLSADFRAISTACAPRGWSPFALPAGTEYTQLRQYGGQVVGRGVAHL